MHFRTCIHSYKVHFQFVDNKQVHGFELKVGFGRRMGISPSCLDRNIQNIDFNSDLHSFVETELILDVCELWVMHHIDNGCRLIF